MFIQSIFVRLFQSAILGEMALCRQPQDLRECWRASRPRISPRPALGQASARSSSNARAFVLLGLILKKELLFLANAKHTDGHKYWPSAATVASS